MLWLPGSGCAQGAVREANPRLTEFETSCFTAPTSPRRYARIPRQRGNHRNCARDESSEDEHSTQLDLGLVETISRSRFAESAQAIYVAASRVAQQADRGLTRRIDNLPPR